MLAANMSIFKLLGLGEGHFEAFFAPQGETLHRWDEIYSPTPNFISTRDL